MRKVKTMLNQEKEQRLNAIRSRLEKSNVVDMSFSAQEGGNKELRYMENVLDILEENQAWLDANARKKAAKYQ
jgi:general stress protein 26